MVWTIPVLTMPANHFENKLLSVAPLFRHSFEHYIDLADDEIIKSIQTAGSTNRLYHD